MAVPTAMSNRHIVSTILEHLSNMKYKDRRQRGPDQPVELLEFRPTLVPSILVNKLWADEGTSILWKRYPHLPALRTMKPGRQQYYANKIERVFSLSPPPGHDETLEYLEGLQWPNLKCVELEVDFVMFGNKFSSMLHAGIERLELSGLQTGGSAYFASTVLPSLLTPCSGLRNLRFGPDIFPEDDPVHVSELYTYLDSAPSVKSLEVKATGFLSMDSLFNRLAQRAGLEELDIDLEPGLSLLPLLQGPNALATPFSSLRRLSIMCYPEICHALLPQLSSLQELQLDVCRIPDQAVQESDCDILNDLFTRSLSKCEQLRSLKIVVGFMAEAFPSKISCPNLRGSTIVQLARTCPKLEDLNVTVLEPAAIDATGITSEEFNSFCQLLPRLKCLSLKLDPMTTSALENSALQSLGKYCKELEILRFKIPAQLPSLPVPPAIPELLVSAPGTTADDMPNRKLSSSPSNTSSASLSLSGVVPELPSNPPVAALFPHLTHLAISRPQSILAIPDDSFTASSTSQSDIIDPELEEELVRSWAHALLQHFPRLEILEAWGDWSRQDNESLNYFLPTEEILASTWEFLSGAEQDLWDDGEGLEDETWHIYESDDWDTASYLNEYTAIDDSMEKLHPFEDEPEGYITPGRVMEKDDFFPPPDVKVDLHPEHYHPIAACGHRSGEMTPRVSQHEHDSIAT